MNWGRRGSYSNEHVSTDHCSSENKNKKRKKKRSRPLWLCSTLTTGPKGHQCKCRACPIATGSSTLLFYLNQRPISSLRPPTHDLPVRTIPGTLSHAYSLPGAILHRFHSCHFTFPTTDSYKYNSAPSRATTLLHSTPLEAPQLVNNRSHSIWPRSESSFFLTQMYSVACQQTWP